MYKIVEIINNGKKEFDAVPERWEENGILSMPLKWSPGTSKLMSDPNSSPLETWPKQMCKVKRANILSCDEAFSIAEKMNLMLVNEEAEEMQLPSKRRRIEDQSDANKNNLTEIMLKVSNLVKIAAEFIEKKEDTEQPIQSTSKHQTLLSEAATENIQTMSKKLDRLFDKVTSMESKMNRCINLLEQHSNGVCFSTTPEEVYKERSPVAALLPIDCEEKLEEAEDMLRDKDTFETYVHSMSLEYMNIRPKMKPLKVCYDLIDKCFTREFLMTCSWTGTSKGGVNKLAFAKYTRVALSFFKIVYSTDSRFTELESKHFIMTVLKNSVSRAAQKRYRNITGKNVDGEEETSMSGDHGTEYEIDDEFDIDVKFEHE